MTYTLTKSSPLLVPPAGSTPSCRLSLSSADQFTNMKLEVIMVFSYGEQPTPRIKDAFAKALIHYYPVAGRIVWLEDEPLVDCTGDGIWFVEAVANCALADVKYFEAMPDIIPIRELLPIPPIGVNLDNQILMVQITEFMCGGFTLGIRMNHMIFDGAGLAQFLKAVGEMAHSLPEPSVKPVWSREDIPFPPKMLSDVQNQSFTAFNFAMSVVDISVGTINRVKDSFFTNTMQKCTTFEIITAMVFKSRVKAINLAPKDKVSVFYAANTRHLLLDIFPSVEGYYGNCVYGVEIVKTSEEINRATLIEVITLVKDSKEGLSTEYMDWINGKSKRCSDMQQEYGRLIISDWTRLGLNEIDYGWGDQLKYITPHLNDFRLYASGTYIKPPKPKQGTRLILRCVEEDQLTEFYRELEKIQAGLEV